MKVSDDFAAGGPNPSRATSREFPDAAPAAANDGEEAKNGAPAARTGILELLLGFVDETVGSADGLIAIYADRARLAVRRKIVQAVVGGAVGVCAVLWLGAAALAIFRGACGGLTVFWGGREWLGDLTGGLLVLIVASSAIAIHLRLSSRREFRRLKAKYERIRNEHDQQHASAPTADDRGGIA
ncbi:MAG: hypothetical protein K8S98_14075 [Planctomycetes bacterium]|nr:hypothetical protein [Planctomycetota bacterium]